MVVWTVAMGTVAMRIVAMENELATVLTFAIQLTFAITEIVHWHGNIGSRV